MISPEDEKMPKHHNPIPRWIKAFLSRCRGEKQRKETRRRIPIHGQFGAMEKSSQLKQVFRLIDANGDGKISPVELGEVLLCLGGHDASTAAREAEGIVSVVDRDGDGLIDLDEFMGVVDGGVEEKEEEEKDLVEAFRVFDADGDGFISAKELRRVFVGLVGHGDSCSLKDCSRMIRGVDRNGDGLVDFQEFRSMMTTELSLSN